MTTRKFMSRKTKKSARTQRGGAVKVPTQKFVRGDASATAPFAKKRRTAFREPERRQSQSQQGSHEARRKLYGAQWNAGAKKYIDNIQSAQPKIHNTTTNTRKIANILTTIQAGRNTEFKGKTTKYNYERIKKLAVTRGLSENLASNLAAQIKKVGTTSLLKSTGSGNLISYTPEAYRGYVSPEDAAFADRIMSSTPSGREGVYINVA